MKDIQNNLARPSSSRAAPTPAIPAPLRPPPPTTNYSSTESSAPGYPTQPNPYYPAMPNTYNPYAYPEGGPPAGTVPQYAPTYQPSGGNPQYPPHYPQYPQQPPR